MELENQILAELASGRLALFCGAGLSSPPPARLPLASELVSQLQEATLGDFADLLAPTQLRPEVLLQLVSRRARQPLLEVLTSILSAGRPNRGHLFAARCLQAECPVVTTNFDCLIEEACHLSGVGYQRLPALSMRRTGNAQLIKAHGSIDASSSLRYTLNHSYRGLEPDIIAGMQAALSGRTILVLGYSGFDQLDVMPALRSCGCRSIYWISHSESPDRAHLADPTEKEIAQLPRLKHYRGDTATLLRALHPIDLEEGSPPPPPAPVLALSKRLRAAITIDILLHENRYHEIEKLIRRHRLGRYLEMRIARLDAIGSTEVRGKRYRRMHENLMADLFALTYRDALPFLPQIARFAIGREELGKAELLVQRALADGDGEVPIVLEAALEVAYELILAKNYARASNLLDGVATTAEKEGEILLAAREAIIRSALYIARCADGPDVESLARAGITAAERAMALLDRSLLNDQYFFSQARNNRANLLRHLGQSQTALELYRQNLAFFREHSVNHTVHTLYNMSFAHRALGQIEAARECLEEAQSVNKRMGRSFMAEAIERELSALLIAE